MRAAFAISLAGHTLLLAALLFLSSVPAVPPAKPPVPLTLLLQNTTSDAGGSALSPEAAEVSIPDALPAGPGTGAVEAATIQEFVPRPQAKPSPPRPRVATRALATVSPAPPAPPGAAASRPPPTATSPAEPADAPTNRPADATANPREAAAAGMSQTVGPTPGYGQALRGWLESHKRYPDDARASGDEGRAIVRFTVDRKGRVLAYSILKSTGSPRLDRALGQMLHDADTLPPFPPEMTLPQIDVTVTMSYSLR